MKIHFYKYQGTGNDFIILDNLNLQYPKLDADLIKYFCNRRFGVGADGLMLLNPKPGLDFEMLYYNADGRESTMCGNGGRCLVKFAFQQGIKKSNYRFMAIDGVHEAELLDDGTVNLKMQDVTQIKEVHGDFILNTGSPHYVKMVNDVMNYDVFHKGMDLRNSAEFVKEGINVNFVEQKKADQIIVRTYERGVEDETLSCGTGVTASALVCFHNEVGYNDVTVVTRGGKLVVKYDRINENYFRDIWLCGPSEKVFEGEIDINL
jgi:diaminopimelate epimerase